jgi:hypothetical protein
MKKDETNQLIQNNAQIDFVGLFGDVQVFIEESRASVALAVNVGLLPFIGGLASGLTMLHYKSNGLNMATRLSLHCRDNWLMNMVVVFLPRISGT